MRLMWTPPILWNLPANGFEQQESKQVSSCESRLNEFEIVEIRVEEGVDLGFGVKDSFYLPMWVL